MNTNADLLKELRIDRKAAPPPSRKGLWVTLAILLALVSAPALAQGDIDLHVHLHEGARSLAAYEAQRLPATAEVVAMNRVGGPERVIDAVEALAPQGFDDVERVLGYAKREQIVKSYAGKAGFSAEQLAGKK